MATHGSSSEDDGENKDSSSDESMVAMYVKKIFKYVKKQANEIKELNALNDLSATIVTNYEHFFCKFKFLSKECDELKSKIESNEIKTSDSCELDESSIPCAIPISKVDASTSCIDLIDEYCSPSCN
jgi:hypothetical protein